MIGEQQARDLAKSYFEAVASRNVDGLLSLCTDDVLYSGLLVRKLTGEASGAVTGKDAVRNFLGQIAGEFSDAALSRVAAGVSSVVVEASLPGMLPVFTVFVVNSEGKIAQIAMHQEVP
jgi:ketosteroid isomerase-like protein